MRAKTGEQKSADRTRSGLVPRSRRGDPTPPTSCNSREQSEFDLPSGRLVSLLLRHLQRAERQLLSETRLNFSTLKIFFLLTHRSGTESPVWQVAVFPLQDVALRPPSKKRPGLSASQRSNREVSVCSGWMYHISPAAQT